MMKSRPHILIGCGAQAKYALEIFFKNNIDDINIFDPIGGKVGKTLDQISIEPLSNLEHLISEKGNLCALVCASDNHLKENLFNQFKDKLNIINAIHPNCSIARRSTLGHGLIINPGAIIQPFAKIGDGCMIHSGVIIEHDNSIGNFVNLAPGVTLAGGIMVGDRTTIYTGTTVTPNVRIGQDVVIGAGSLVMSDVPDNAVVYGSPARQITPPCPPQGGNLKGGPQRGI